MNIVESKEMLKRYTLARIPLVVFNSFERARSLELIKSTSADLSLPFYVHTMSKGTCDIQTGKLVNDDRSVIGALDFMTEQFRQRQNITFVLTEVADIADDCLTSRYLMDVLSLAEENGGAIIVITNSPVWGQLQRLGMAVFLDLPDENEILETIMENIEPYRRDIKIDWDNNDFREAATTMTGVSQVEVQNIIASLVATRHIKNPMWLL